MNQKPVPKALKRLAAQQRKQQWQAAAQKMAPDYACDLDLTAFSSLDSEALMTGAIHRAYLRRSQHVAH